MEDIILHIYYGNRFKEADLKNFSKTVFTLGGPGADLQIDSSLYGDKVSFEKEESGVHISSGNSYNIIFGGHKVAAKEALPGDIFSITTANENKNIAVVMVKKKSEYPDPDIPFDLSKKDKIKIGRGEMNDIIFADRMVSEEHAEIINDGGYYTINDSSSRNGTYVNGIKIKSKRLEQNDVITACGNKLIYKNGTLLAANLGFGTEVKNIPAAAAPGKVKQDYPYYQRSPRLIPAMPSGEIEIPAPPQKSGAQPVNWLTVLLPSSGIFIVAIVMLVAGMSNPTMIVLSVVMAAVSIITAIVTYTSQNKKASTDEANRQNLYYQMIERKRAEIKNGLELQKKALQEMYPDKHENMRIVQGRQRRMWERTPAHSDFLSVRLGIGNVPSSVIIKGPKADVYGQADTLLAEAQRLETQYGYVQNAPFINSLKNEAPLGLIGSRPEVLGVARSMIMDIATHHSYDEVKIVTVFPEAETKEWEELRWIPHIYDANRNMRFMANNKKSVREIFSAIYEEIRLREMSQTSGKKEDKAAGYVFFIASRQLVQDEQLMTYLLNPKTELGVYPVIMFDSMEMLPRDCRCIVGVSGNSGQIIKGAKSNQTFILDKATVNEAEQFSRSMAPVKLKQIIDPYNLPSSISFYDMYGAQSPADFDIEKRWISSEPYLGLSVPVGIGQNGKQQAIRLGEGARDYGLHGLVAGTSGSGKSEFLQTLILSLAVNYHPDDVQFVLVDYKGGAMANAFKGLPHLAGIITNLGGNQTDRALMSINSEVRRRQTVLEKAGVDHIHRYQRKYRNGEVSEPLPHLFIIVDEFAELKSEKPEFISGLVSASRLGRSLGVKLILATQKPSGIVDEQIKGNTGYNICLKVQTPGDSKEILDRPDAALINNPGRSYLRVGADNIYEMFQSAWSGAECASKDANAYAVKEVELDGHRQPLSRDIFKVELNEARTQLQELSGYIGETAVKSNIKKPHEIWLPPLPEAIALDDLGNTAKPSIGLVDNPSAQKQYPLEIDFAKDGHLAVYGAPASGKTTLLQTLIVSISRKFSPEDYNIFILDFGARTLGLFEKMPQVGGIVMVDEAEKLKNLFKYVIKEVERRKVTFADMGVANFVSYKLAAKEKLPSIVLIIDNYPALIEVYPETEDQLVQISREGSNLGVYIVLTANTLGAVKYKISSNIKSAIALQMTDKADYTSIVGKTNGLEPSPLDGRGLLKDNPPLEFQTALPVKGETESERAQNIRKLSEDLSGKCSSRAFSIPEMPKKLNPEILYKTAKSYIKIGADVPVGIDFEDIEPVLHHFSEEEHMLVTGHARSGKSTFLLSIAELLSQKSKDGENIEIFIFDSRFASLQRAKSLKQVRGYATDKDESEGLLKSVLKTAEERRTQAKNEQQSEIFILIDDYHNFCEKTSQESRNVLETLIKRERALKVHIILCGMISDIVSGWEGFVKALREMQTGMLFSSASDQQIFNIRVPYTEASKALKPGEGYYICRGNVKKVKTANIQ